MAKTAAQGFVRDNKPRVLRRSLERLQLMVCVLRCKGESSKKLTGVRLGQNEGGSPGLRCLDDSFGVWMIFVMCFSIVCL